VGEGWLYEAVCRQRADLWVRVGYMKLCIQRAELWVRVGYMKLFIDRELDCE
jgi:hypothetical protein